MRGVRRMSEDKSEDAWMMGDCAESINFVVSTNINPAIWNPPAPAGGGMRRTSREVALL
jgi:hypothetical protein